MDLDRLLEPIQPKKLKPCKVTLIVDSLEGKYKEAVVNMLAKTYLEGGLTDEAIADRLVSAGLPIGSTTIRRHRSGSCTCEKAEA